jgi:uncharacterized protein (UPF0276 family)
VKLPDGAVGIGLRPPHYRALAEGEARLEDAPAGQGTVDYVEVIADNFMNGAAAPLYWLDRVRERTPIVVHSLALNVLGADALDEEYLVRLEALCARVNAPFVSDHLCWSSSRGAHFHDLLPTPYTEEVADYAASRVRAIQSRLARPFGLENLSSYARFASSTLTEWGFYTRVVADSDAWFMLDINNVYVSANNHGFDATTYLQAIPKDRVLQIHLAGHEELPNGALLDTHDQPVKAAVWELYRGFVAARGSAPPTLIERDDRIPALAELVAETARAKQSL